MKNQQEFTIKHSGRDYQVSGDPTVLTLRDALMQTTQQSSSGGKQGGEGGQSGGQSSWNKSQFRVESAGGQTREYTGESDLNKTFQQLGITPGSTIEVLSPANV